MTTHIWKEKVHHPPSNKTHWAHKMICGILLPKNFGGRGDDAYVTKEMITKNLLQGFGGGSWDDECTECFNHPLIQLLTLANVDLGG